jgi:hypothetical protein
VFYSLIMMERRVHYDTWPDYFASNSYAVSLTMPTASDFESETPEHTHYPRMSRVAPEKCDWSSSRAIHLLDQSFIIPNFLNLVTSQDTSHAFSAAKPNWG